MMVYVVLKNFRDGNVNQYNIFKGVYTNVEDAYEECDRLCRRDYMLARYPKETYKNVTRYKDVVFNGGDSCVVAEVEGHIFKQGYSSIEYYIRKVII